MIDTDLDIKINALQGRVHKTTMEIYRLQEENIEDLKKMRDLVAERDRISGLKTRVIDGEIHGAHGGPHHEDLPDTCRECGGTCSMSERRICLAEIDEVS